LSRRWFVEWGARWRYVSVAEMTDFLSVFSHFRYRTIGFAGAFGRDETQRNLLAILDQQLFNRITPESWRYIMAGVATK
jgi:hypothetical protein